MGYRLNADAWPDEFLQGLARRFMVITIDNRGTGISDKPVEGYALSSMAGDVLAVLDHLGIERAHILGYSMGGGIAQELVNKNPDRVAALVLCATMCGGVRGVRAPLSVLRVMRDLDGLAPEEIGRRIWQFTYAPDYLAEHRDTAERQLQREIVKPTPLHAADLQFQALAEFDMSAALPYLDAPTLVLTGDLDKLVPPDNSVILAGLIPGATLQVLTGCGHRIMWEAPARCATMIADFLSAHDDALAAPPEYELPQDDRQGLPYATEPATLPTLEHHWRRGIEFLFDWPWAFEDFMADLVAKTMQPAFFGRKFSHGDGKPIVLVPPRFMGDNALAGFSLWLKSLGYRPTGVGILFNLDDKSMDRAVTEAIRRAARRVGRKVVILAFGTGIYAALRTASPDLVSDIVTLCRPRDSCLTPPAGLRLHAISPEPSTDAASETIITHKARAYPLPIAPSPESLLVLSDVLRDIRLELIDPEFWRKHGTKQR
jgi:pimeloyl-ACP methyl ester carboxylesterase